MTNLTLGTSAPTAFQFQSHSVRTLLVDDQPWFVAADVCTALDLGNVTMALRRLDDDEHALSSIEGISRGNDQANIINESGLYSLVLRSRKPEARAFKKWVTSEVLPAIRKTGRYESGSAQPDLSSGRWLTHADDDGRLIFKPLPHDAIVTSPSKLAPMIAELGGYLLSNAELAAIAHACAVRLALRFPLDRSACKEAAHA